MRFQFLMCTIYLCLASEHSRKCAHAQHLDWFVCLQLSVCACANIFYLLAVCIHSFTHSALQNRINTHCRVCFESRIRAFHFYRCCWFIYVFRLCREDQQMNLATPKPLTFGCIHGLFFFCSKIVNCFRLMWKTSSSVWDKKNNHWNQI